MDSTGITKGYSCFSPPVDQQFNSWVQHASRHFSGLRVKLASLGNFMPIINERQQNLSIERSWDSRSVTRADRLTAWLEQSFHKLLLKYWYSYSHQERRFIASSIDKELLSGLLHPLQEKLKHHHEKSCPGFEQAIGLIDALASDYETSDTHVDLFDNLESLQSHFIPEYTDSIQNGLCHALSASYIQAALLADSLTSIAPLVTFSDRLHLLSRNKTKGWYFFGERFTDLSKAVDKAEAIYKDFHQQNRGSFYDAFSTEFPEAFQLMELRPWLELIVQCQKPATTELRHYSRNMDAARNLSLMPSRELESSCIDSQTPKKDHQDVIIRTKYIPIKTSLLELEQILSKLPAGHYMLSTFDHEIALSVNDHTLTVFDQNQPSYFFQTSRKHLSQLARHLMDSVNEGSSQDYAVFAVSGYFTNTPCGKADKVTVESHLNRLANGLIRHSHEVEDSCSTPSGCTQLFLAANYGNLDFVQSRLHFNPEELNQCSHDNRTPLSVAAGNGHSATVAFLLRSNADATKCSSEGASPLRCAAESGRTDIIDLLLQHNADINEPDIDGVTPLETAAENGFEDTVKFLLEHGANPNLCDNKGYSPLHAAAQNGHTGIIKLLAEHNAEIDQLSKQKFSPLYLAVCKKQAASVKALLELGAKATFGRYEAYSPLACAQKFGYQEIVEIFQPYDCTEKPEPDSVRNS